MRLGKLTLLLFACMFSGTCFAQQFTGHITDSSGAAIPAAEVAVHNINTNVDILAAATKTGDYTVPYLKPGVYNITVSAAKFSSETKTGITLQEGQTATVNFRLSVGGANESITVDGGTPLLNFGKADQGDVVETTRVTELPLNGRDPFMLATLNAGVIWTGYVGYQRPFDDTMASLSINGGGGSNNEILLDGVSNESAHGNSNVGYVPPVDAVQEFKIVTNPYDAAYGRAQGGVVDMSLKSGTNSLHGTAYEFLRRGWLDSNTYSTN